MHERRVTVVGSEELTVDVRRARHRPTANPQISGPFPFALSRSGTRRHPHDLCERLGSTITCLPNSLRSEERKRVDDDSPRLPVLRDNTYLQHRRAKNGGLFEASVRCYSRKLICVCYRVILPLW